MGSDTLPGSVGLTWKTWQMALRGPALRNWAHEEMKWRWADGD